MFLLALLFSEDTNTKLPFSFACKLSIACYMTLSFFQEIYSIKLPGNPKLGEGKPENQNHAIIFTRGDAIQTIDMNQVNHDFVFVA